MDMQKDDDQLQLLSTFHYVVAGITGLFAIFPIIHLVVGIAIVSGAFNNMDGQAPGEAGPPAFMGWIFIAAASVGILIGMALAISIGIAGSKLKKRQSHTYCMVIACLECMFMPFGTVLGILTIIALQKPSVKELFEQGEQVKTGPEAELETFLSDSAKDN